MEQNKTQDNLSKTIVLVVLIILALVIYKSPKLPPKVTKPADTQTQTANTADILKLRSDDYANGITASAQVTIIEYSDLECPFCRLFHGTLMQAMQKYPGKIVWVYRNYPIESLHKKTRFETNALECIGGIGGNTAYWNALNEIMATTKSNDGLDLSTIPTIAKNAGVSQTDFEQCMTNKTYDAKIMAQVAEVQALGVQGTPFSIVINNATGETTPIMGYQKFEKFDETLQKIIKN
ncbi:MAG: thioredoxin domain-containing protein [bacterium]